MKLEYKYFGTICVGLMSCLPCLRAIFVLAKFLLVVFRLFFSFKRDEVTGNGENYIMKSSVICTPYRILCGW